MALDSHPHSRCGPVPNALRSAHWAEDAGLGESQLLRVETGERTTPMWVTTATAERLVTNNALGADIIRLAAGDGFEPHTHAGDHLLIVIGGQGTLTYGGEVHPTRAGEIYLVEGSVPHAVGAITDHVLLAVGSPHVSVGAPDRMEPVEYRAITTGLDDLRCLICDLEARFPRRLHHVGCTHCPCVECRAGNRAGRDLNGQRS